MTVGESLTEARYQAGLSVDELSERTRIRDSVIRSIERDDYDALGGDLYVRGYVRAIAGAVGIDAQPLIQEFDQERVHASEGGTDIIDAEGGAHGVGGGAHGAEGGANGVGGGANGVGGGVNGAEGSANGVGGGANGGAYGGGDGAYGGGDDTEGGVNGVNGDSAVSGARPYVPVASAVAPSAPSTLSAPSTPSAPSAPSGPGGADPAATSLDLPAVPAGGSGGHDPDETRFDLPAVHDDPSATRFDLPPVRADHTEDMMAAGYDLQPESARAVSTGSPSGGWSVPATGGWADPMPRRDSAAAASTRTGRDRRRNRGLLIGVAAVAVLAIVAVVGVRLASSPASTVKNAANSTTARAAGATARGTSGAAAKASAKPTATTKPAVKPTKAPAPKPAARPPVTLLPVTAAYAYGPGGLGDGDNPQGASNAIARNPPLPWSTNWYATAQFGMLKHGTGLLLSLGRTDTITSVLVDLTQYQGVNLQLKVGDGTAPGDFKVAATADDTGGAVRLTFRHPASGRYLLIWFTQLPPNGDGRFQESVYHVLVNGRR